MLGRTIKCFYLDTGFGSIVVVVDMTTAPESTAVGFLDPAASALAIARGSIIKPKACAVEAVEAVEVTLPPSLLLCRAS